jgi:hypothetical protein
MTTTESTLISPTHHGVDDVDASEPNRRPRRRRAPVAVLGAAIVLVAALLAGSLTGGGRAATKAAADEVERSDRSSTHEPGVETSSTLIERDSDALGGSDEDDPSTVAPSTGDQADDDAASQPGIEPASLEASTTSLGFGQHTSKKTFTIQNDGGAALTWDAQESKAWMTVAPVEGSIQPGASQVIEVTVNRVGMPDGTSFQGDLTIDSNGGDAVVHVTGSTPFGMAQPVPAEIESVNHMPVICSANSPGGSKTTPIVAKVSGPDIDGVKLYWSLNGGFPSGMDMVKSGADTWMVPAFGNLPQGVVELVIYVENQYGDDTVERQITFMAASKDCSLEAFSSTAVRLEINLPA